MIIVYTATHIHDPSLSLTVFRNSLKTHLFVTPIAAAFVIWNGRRI